MQNQMQTEIAVDSALKIPEYLLMNTLTFLFADNNKNYVQLDQKLPIHQYFHDCVHMYPIIKQNMHKLTLTNAS